MANFEEETMVTLQDLQSLVRGIQDAVKAGQDQGGAEAKDIFLESAGRLAKKASKTLSKLLLRSLCPSVERCYEELEDLRMIAINKVWSMAGDIHGVCSWMATQTAQAQQGGAPEPVSEHHDPRTFKANQQAVLQDVSSPVNSSRRPSPAEEDPIVQDPDPLRNDFRRIPQTLDSSDACESAQVESLSPPVILDEPYTSCVICGGSRHMRKWRCGSCRHFWTRIIMAHDKNRRLPSCNHKGKPEPGCRGCRRLAYEKAALAREGLGGLEGVPSLTMARKRLTKMWELSAKVSQRRYRPKKDCKE